MTNTVAEKQSVAILNQAQAGVVPSSSDFGDGAIEDTVVRLGYQPALPRDRSMATILIQVIAMTCIPYGEASAFLYAVYGGGPLTIFVGWIVVGVLCQCLVQSLAELASHYPTTAGPYYWSYQLIGNWTILLGVNFGIASFISATVAIYHPEFVAEPWQLLLMFFGMCIFAAVVCTLGNKILPYLESFNLVWTFATILAICIGLLVKASYGRRDAAYALGHFDHTLSGWGNFSFMIGFLPPAYVFAAVGIMISAMAEEVTDPARAVPKAMNLTIPVCLVAGLPMILPICFTLPPLEVLLQSPQGQVWPYMFTLVMGSRGGGFALTFLVLGCALFALLSLTTAVSRVTWALARDNAIPFSSVFGKIDKRLDVPVNAIILLTVVQMLLGFINLGSNNALQAFIGGSVIGVNLSYIVPVVLSLIQGRAQVRHAAWNMGNTLGFITNIIAVLWAALQCVLFSMPAALPVTAASMNYASVVFMGLFVLSIIWYFVYAHKGMLQKASLTSGKSFADIST